MRTTVPLSVAVLTALGACAGDGASADPNAAARKVPIGELAVPQSWAVGASSASGTTELVRYREHGASVQAAGHHPVRLMVTSDFDESPRAVREANRLEDDLCALFEPGNQVLLWLVRSEYGTRRWVFYGASTEDAASRIERARLLVAERRASLEVQHDAAWNMYHAFTPK